MLAAALRANSTLMSLALTYVSLWDNPAVAAELLGALTGHASLQVLCLRDNEPEAARQAAAGETLGALVAANAPALTELDVSYSDLGDTGLRPLLEALPANTHLRTLRVEGNSISEAFHARRAAAGSPRKHEPAHAAYGGADYGGGEGATGGARRGGSSGGVNGACKMQQPQV
jgi:hypothetical protein